MRPILLAVACCLAAFAPARSISVGRIKFDELVRYSDSIVVARVTSVTRLDRPEGERKTDSSRALDQWRSEGTVRVAEAEVLRVVKGERATTKVHFLAQATWTCDISDAKVGETALLFLRESSWVADEGPTLRAALRESTGGSAMFVLMHSGRGRMPIRQVGASDFATYWTDVVMPKELENVDGPEPEYSGFIRSAALADLEKLALEAAKNHGAMVRGSESAADSTRRDWSCTVWSDRFSTQWTANKAFHEGALAAESTTTWWSPIESGECLSWPDGARLGDSKPTRELVIAIDGQQRRLRLPDPATLVAPLEAKLEREIRTWLALRDLIDDADATDTRAAYRAVLSK